jgi:hypothetical protein
MTVADRLQARARFAGDIERFTNQCKSILASPERTWSASLPSLSQFASTEKDPTVRMLLDIGLPVFSQVFQTALRSNTQLRLLRVHALIQSFRWNTGRLPVSLDELSEKQACLDPLVDAPFTYSVDGTDYVLFSKGVTGVGRIDLVYVRSKALDNGPDGPVNP